MQAPAALTVLACPGDGLVGDPTETTVPPPTLSVL